MSSEQARCQGGQAKGKNRHPCRPFPCPFPWQKTEEKKQRPDCARQLVHHHDFQDKMSKDVNFQIRKIVVCLLFCPPSTPHSFSPRKQLLRQCGSFEGKQACLRSCKVSNVRSFLSLCSSFPQTLKTQPYRGIGAKEEGSGRHSSAKVEFQPSSVRAKGLCARKKQTRIGERIHAKKHAIAISSEFLRGYAKFSKNVDTYKKEDTGIGGVKKWGWWCLLPFKEPYATVRVSCSSPLFSSSVLDSWTSRRGTQTNHAIACF